MKTGCENTFLTEMRLFKKTEIMFTKKPKTDYNYGENVSVFVFVISCIRKYLSGYSVF